jgi:hypothetical protein
MVTTAPEINLAATSDQNGGCRREKHMQKMLGRLVVCRAEMLDRSLITVPEIDAP